MPHLNKTVNCIHFKLSKAIYLYLKFRTGPKKYLELMGKSLWARIPRMYPLLHGCASIAVCVVWHEVDDCSQKLINGEDFDV